MKQVRGYSLLNDQFVENTPSVGESNWAQQQQQQHLGDGAHAATTNFNSLSTVEPKCELFKYFYLFSLLLVIF